MKSTGYYDSHGIPIHVGDLIRVTHYKHVRNRRQMWLYFRVAIKDGITVVQNWDNLNTEQWQCRLDYALFAGTSEVLAEHGLERNKDGGIVTFNERPRRKVTQ